MYSSSDCERLFIRYKAEAMPRKSMIQDIKSYRYRFERKENTEPCPVRMMIDIRMTNGIRIQQQGRQVSMSRFRLQPAAKRCRNHQNLLQVFLLPADKLYTGAQISGNPLQAVRRQDS